MSRTGDLFLLSSASTKRRCKNCGATTDESESNRLPLLNVKRSNMNLSVEQAGAITARTLKETQEELEAAQHTIQQLREQLSQCQREAQSQRERYMNGAMALFRENLGRPTQHTLFLPPTLTRPVSRPATRSSSHQYCLGDSGDEEDEEDTDLSRTNLNYFANSHISMDDKPNPTNTQPFGTAANHSEEEEEEEEKEAREQEASTTRVLSPPRCWWQVALEEEEREAKEKAKADAEAAAHPPSRPITDATRIRQEQAFLERLTRAVDRLEHEKRRIVARANNNMLSAFELDRRLRHLRNDTTS